MTLIEEMMLAGRGVVALLMGRRDAPQYFDLTLRGLAGSFVAFLVATTLNAYLPVMLSSAPEGTSAAQALLVVGVLYAVQMGFSAIVLNQLGRLDGLVPYLVAGNWGTFFVTLFTLLLSFASFDGGLALLMIGILVIVIEINTARIIVTLKPMQIVMFLVAQMVGVLLALTIIGMVLPVPEMVPPVA